MTLTVYNCTDAPNVVNKTLTGGSDITNVQPCEPCDILNPSFIINKSSISASNNYIVAGSPLNRNYFITSMQLLTGNRYLVSCSVDVLTTYADGIINCNGTVLRSESVGNPTMIADGRLPIQTNNRIIDCDNFPDTPFTVGDRKSVV